MPNKDRFRVSIILPGTGGCQAVIFSGHHAFGGAGKNVAAALASAIKTAKDEKKTGRRGPADSRVKAAWALLSDLPPSESKRND